MILLAWGIAACGLGAGLFLYERFAGEHPLLDGLYDLRLRGLDIEALDRRNLENACRSDVIVTMTTLPSRIDRIGPTIKSLLNQTVSPAAIRLNVPEASRREGTPYLIPAWLARLRSVTIVRSADYGPATKLIPTLLAVHPGQRLIVVDDDRIYHRHLVEQLLRQSGEQPGAAVGGSGWDVPPDLTDRPTTIMATLRGTPPAPIKCTRVGRARDVDILQGLGGYLVKADFFDAARLADYTGAPDAAFFVDDVWISAHCRVRKVVCRGRRTNFPSLADARFFKRSSVALVNRGTGTVESRNNTIMLRYFKDCWPSAGKKGYALDA